MKIFKNIIPKIEIVLKCVFVIRIDLNMIKITHGLSKLIAQLSTTTNLRKEMAKRKVKISKIITKNPKSFFYTPLLSEII